ncbi:hypothetical protein KCU92_g228, partial [Aureobasidium melanogenum]
MADQFSSGNTQSKKSKWGWFSRGRSTNAVLNHSCWWAGNLKVYGFGFEVVGQRMRAFGIVVDEFSLLDHELSVGLEEETEGLVVGVTQVIYVADHVCGKGVEGSHLVAEFQVSGLPDADGDFADYAEEAIMRANSMQMFCILCL